MFSDPVDALLKISQITLALNLTVIFPLGSLFPFQVYVLHPVIDHLTLNYSSVFMIFIAFVFVLLAK